MIKRLLQSAFDSGSDVIIHVKGLEDGFRGRIQNFDGEFLTVFHNGCCQGVLWAFEVKEILTCGLLVPVPADPENHEDPPQECHPIEEAIDVEDM